MTTTEVSQQQKWFERGTQASSMVLVVAIAYAVAKMIWMPWNAPVVPMLDAKATVSRPTSTSNIDTHQIGRWDLFGKNTPLTQAPASQQAVINAPETKLQLELKGVSVSVKDKESTAIISEARQEEKVYKKGDRVPGNATVEAIYTDRVLLNTNGKLEVLRFPENNEGGGGLSMQANSQPELSPMQPDTESPIQMPATSPPPAPPAGMIPQVNEQNADQALAEIGLSRNANGQGYKVVPGGAASELLRAMGGKENDVLMSINGRAVGDPTQDQGTLSEIMQQSSVKLEWERDGRRFSTTFDPKTLGGM